MAARLPLTDTLALTARIARLRAEAEDQAPNFSVVRAAEGAEFMRVEQSAYALRRAEQTSLASVLAARMKPSRWIVAMVIALVNWVQVARIVYTETRGLVERDFIMAERALGAGHGRIVFRHILPHLIPTAIVWGTLGIATTVLLEATLSFLGVGVQPPQPSWGNIIFESQSYFQAAPWLVFFPGALILVTALAFNLVGDALRDILDPTQRGRG